MVGVNMSKHDEQAYIRGVRAAGIWKRLKHTVASWDQRGTAWAKNHNIPVWIGRVPLVAAILISLTCLIAGGFIVAFIVAFIWGMLFIAQNTGNNLLRHENTNASTTHAQFRNGSQGYGLYSGSEDLVTSHRIDLDD